MSGPTETYCAWFESLPPEVAREMAVALMQLFPGGLLRPAILTSDPTDGFVPRLRRLATDAIQDTGTAATLAALTELVFERVASGQGTERTKALLNFLNEAQEALTDAGDPMDPDVQDWVTDQQLRQPLRARQWARERGRWQKVQQESLSTAKLDEALRKAMFGFMPE